MRTLAPEYAMKHIQNRFTKAAMRKILIGTCNHFYKEMRGYVRELVILELDDRLFNLNDAITESLEGHRLTLDMFGSFTFKF